FRLTWPGRLSDQLLEPFQRESEVSAPFRRDEGMDFVDDDRLDSPKSFSGVRRENQVERLGCGDENVSRVTSETLAFALRGIARADTDLRLMEGNATAARHIGDAGQRRSQVALHIDG